MENNPSLTVNQVTKIYGEGPSAVLAVDRVSYEIFPGEFVAVVGPSGSGKTSMLAILATLLKPTSGSIHIDGQDLSRMKESERNSFRRQKIGFTFQANNLIPYLTAQENVELMLRLNGKLDKGGQRRAITLLERLGLGERLGNLPNALSGGEQQRVAIARALVHEPALVLADEPTASLDTQRAYQVVETFAKLIHEQNRIGIMVTHDLRMIGYTDKIISMVDGRIDLITSDCAVIERMAGTGSADLPFLFPNGDNEDYPINQPKAKNDVIQVR